MAARIGAEGWYKDPYGKHDDRWFSGGEPTSLVRDGRVESHDPPPDAPLPATLVPSETNQETDGDDLRRADDAGPEAPYNAFDDPTLWGFS